MTAGRVVVRRHIGHDTAITKANVNLGKGIFTGRRAGCTERSDLNKRWYEGICILIRARVRVARAESKLSGLVDAVVSGRADWLAWLIEEPLNTSLHTMFG
ncbi:hypothetical protein HRR83_007835 [Exophiala dermatitidis]|uniref:Uncharacterized protein n=1 Tax=Exophiala dermatitidis TaxID=5970 RepID=A0AAN6ES53_EXODE|nr:hypothetical protein HRR74_007509 [Exophiala dermatitidis]KAJ4510169.1 hypothetical protein HRR73_006967 [Exophiala dermatitidis]KAJ4539175.1 hypothetical protein HRR77_006588 [Exophiala dermatitidis]KAJ4540546.1 hypothetical protein HRR76_003934 [Exophiala dermatitidis]KAJ4564622.1 hypothetical protein HRR79_005879 [Exophiala dermatitidis]